MLPPPELANPPSLPSLQIPGQGAPARGLRVLAELGCDSTFGQPEPPYSQASGVKHPAGQGNGASLEQEAGHLGNKSPTGWGAHSAYAGASPLLGVQVAAPEAWAWMRAEAQCQVHPTPWRKQQVETWLAELEGGSAGKALAPKPGTQASPSWSAKGPCCGRLASKGTSLSTEGQAHQLPQRQPPDQPDGFRAGFTGFVITALRLVWFLAPKSLTPRVVSGHPQPSLLGSPLLGAGRGWPAWLSLGSATLLYLPPGSVWVADCSAWCVLPHSPLSG